MSSLQTGGPNQGQVEHWNSAVGDLWVGVQPRFDRLFENITRAILDAAAPQPGMDVLDVGAGAGDLTLTLAKRAMPSQAVALDVSAPLLRHAASRFAAAELHVAETLLADAASHPFAADSFDLAVSRFGVMFFADPPAGFANIARGLRPGGRLVFGCWGPLSGNPWFSMPRKAGIAVLGDPDAGAPRSLPFTPGPFQLSDADQLRDVLVAAGFSNVSIETQTIPLIIPGELADAIDLATTLGPVSRLMRDEAGTPDDLAKIRHKLAELFAPYVEEDRVAVPALIHIVTAHA